ncbi:11565_t:CDS:2 [Funneliformis caledonium]|uniref:11565_t:CDS:1 n=1 Tax=Funneliformis caledonium TaxID=1117310 RepID=A0A9N9NCG6_9GLOM|nr:11565_t:CDS:2 [Funneliformis caledonium]
MKKDLSSETWNGMMSIVREDLNGEDVRKWYNGYVYNPPEYVYHAFCMGMFVVARDRGYNVHEAGKGRFVIRIVHKSDAVIDMAIVIEFKVVDDKESSESARSN